MESTSGRNQFFWKNRERTSSTDGRWWKLVVVTVEALVWSVRAVDGGDRFFRWYVPSMIRLGHFPAPVGKIFNTAILVPVIVHYCGLLLGYCPETITRYPYIYVRTRIWVGSGTFDAVAAVGFAPFARGFTLKGTGSRCYGTAPAPFVGDSLRLSTREERKKPTVMRFDKIRYNLCAFHNAFGGGDFRPLRFPVPVVKRS